MDGDNLKFLSYMNDLVELFNLGIKLCLFKVICRSCGIDYLTPLKRQYFPMMVLPGNYKFASMPLVSVHLVNHLKKKFFLAIGLLGSKLNIRAFRLFHSENLTTTVQCARAKKKNNESDVIATFCGLL